MKSVILLKFEFLSSGVKRVISCCFANLLFLFPFSLPSPALIGSLIYIYHDDWGGEKAKVRVLSDIIAR